jgi:hypothetical protein
MAKPFFYKHSMSLSQVGGTGLGRGVPTPFHAARAEPTASTVTIIKTTPNFLAFMTAPFVSG